MTSKTPSEKKGTYQAALLPRKTAIAQKRKATTVDSRALTELQCMEEALHASEERYRSILENIEDGYYEADLAGNFTFFNDAICRIWGYSKEELMGMNNRQYMDKETAAKLYATHNLVYKTGKPGSQFDYEIIRKDKKRRIVQASFSLLKDKEDRPIGFRGMIRDVTDRRIAEDALRKSEEKYRQAFSSTSDIIIILDNELKISSITPSVEKILGYKPEEMIQRRFDQMNIMTPANQEKLNANILKALSGKSVSNVIYEFIAKDGSIKFGDISGSPIQKNGTTIGIIAIARNVTERRKMEDAIRQSEEKYRTIIETIQDGYIESDPTGNFTFVNDVVCGHLGYSREELIGINSRKLLTEPSVKTTSQAFSEVYKTGIPLKSIEMEAVRKDGTTRFYDLSVSLIKDAKGKPIGFRNISRDTTERKQMVESLRKSEEKYRTIVENSQEGIFQSDLDNGHLTLNQAFASMLGYATPENATKSITDIASQVYVDPDEYGKVRDILRRESHIKGYETEFYRKDKSRIWVNMSISLVRDSQGNMLYYHGIVEDITLKKKLEQERQDSINSLRKSLGATIHAMSATVEARDPYTAGHQRRVADLARAIATEMQLPRDQIDGIRLAGMIHDLGKISVPSEILTKPTRLSNLELELIRTHSEAGYNILKDIEFPWPIARIVLEHHERIDGSGYPNGLKGENILLESKIIAIADVVEAISSHRPYRPALGIGPALDEIVKNSGILYDATAAGACLKLFRENRYKMPE